jgi:proteasome alpha subunit
MKPMEVEILVAEVGLTPDDDQMFHILYDGTVFDHQDYAVLGGDADAILGRIGESFSQGLAAAAAVRAGAAALAGPERTLPSAELEVALLERGNGRRCFRRLTDAEVDSMLAPPPTSDEPSA